jgi:carbamate kinase
MRIVVAVGGNALLERGEVPLAQTQEPLAIVELPTVAALVADGAIVICAGGGGIPVLEDDNGHLHGAEAVIDKGLSTALLARDLGADALVILTDVANVEIGFGTDAARPIGRTTPAPCGH